VSQAGSELSINTFDDQSSSLNTPLTSGSGTFSFPQSTDVVSDQVNTEDQRRQIEELQEQLRQMMTSSAQDDATSSFSVQSASKSSSFWSSETTVTVTAEVTSLTTSSRVLDVTRNFQG
jgi:outer membrane receptor for Fe3+-dicitrate